MQTSGTLLRDVLGVEHQQPTCKGRSSEVHSDETIVPFRVSQEVISIQIPRVQSAGHFLE